MSSASDDFLDKAVKIMTDEDFSASSLGFIGNMIELGNAPRLISALTSPSGDVSSVVTTMQKLESFANVSQSLGCALMVYLWPVASERMVHDVADAIDLWVQDCHCDRLTTRIEQAAKSERDDETRKHYEQFLKLRTGVNNNA